MAFLCAEIPGSGGGLVASRDIEQGEVLVKEMPLAVSQDVAGLRVTPACLTCLRACGPHLSALQHALELIGEQLPCRDGTTNHVGLSCATCGGPFCSVACSDRARAHKRLCGHPAAAGLRELTVTHSDAVWLTALLITEVVLAVEGGGSLEAAASRNLGLFSHPWEDIPRWGSTQETASDMAHFSNIRRNVITEVSRLLQQVFPDPAWSTVTGEQSVSRVLGMLDTTALLPWVRSEHNEGWSHSDIMKWLRERVPCIREAVLQGLEQRQVFTYARHEEDIRERREDPLWVGFPPTEGAALYPTVGRMNHSCSCNIKYSWDADSTVTLTARRNIVRGEELTIEYIDPELPLRVRQQRLREDFGFLCRCPRCGEEEGMSGSDQDERGMAQEVEEVESDGETESDEAGESDAEDTDQEASKEHERFRGSLVRVTSVADTLRLRELVDSLQAR